MLTETTIWTTPWLRPFNDVAALDDLLAQIHPTWSLGRIKARVLAVIAETADTRTFVLRANRHWPGFLAGQHVGVEVEIAGVRHQRRYSLSSAPTADRVIAITVKRRPGGKVSSWLHDHVRAGSVLGLEPPAGAFVLPEPLPERLLMLSAGSGITPLMAMLRALVRTAAPVDVAFVHVARDPADAIFAAELARLAAITPGLARHHHDSRHGRVDPRALAHLVPDWDERHTWLCGPATFMATSAPTSPPTGSPRGCGRGVRSSRRSGTASAAAAREIRCVRSERLFTADGDTPLLVAAERAVFGPATGAEWGSVTPAAV